MNKAELKLTDMAGGVTAPGGYIACGVACGLKNGSLDLALLYSERPAGVAGVYTSNKVKAAPLLLTRERVKGGVARAVVINAGNANACNGARGLEDAQKMTAEAARLLGVPAEQVLVASTGVIGQPLPMEKVLPGIEKAVGSLSPAAGREAARAIMTTDTVAKEAAVQLVWGGEKVTLGGMAKGSGMIHPNMATMLAFITTDAALAPEALQEALKYAVDRSFNMITVDGDTSTNDMALLLANGASGRSIEPGSSEFDLFKDALVEVCTRLAVMIARDGEGATKLLEVKVINAPTEKDARLAARAVAGSMLVKSAVFGRDANWGRILCAVGYSGAQFDPGKVNIFVGDEQVARDGGSVAFSEERARDILSREQVTLLVDLGNGEHGATAWGCDLTYDYVKINASYRS